MLYLPLFGSLKIQFPCLSIFEFTNFRISYFIFGFSFFDMFLFKKSLIEDIFFFFQIVMFYWYIYWLRMSKKNESCFHLFFVLHEIELERFFKNFFAILS